MKKNSRRKTTLFLLTLAMMALWVSTTSLPAAAETDLQSVTGQIAGVQKTIITVNDGGVYYPVTEMNLPSWIKVGERVSLLYARKRAKNYYYEVVRPGDQFKTFEDLRKAKMEKK